MVGQGTVMTIGISKPTIMLVDVFLTLNHNFTFKRFSAEAIDFGYFGIHFSFACGFIHMEMVSMISLVF